MVSTALIDGGSDRSSTSNVSEVTNAIRDAIVRGDYAPNQRLIEADLSTAFGASRGAVRAALFELASDGLIDRLPNRGSRVRAITLDEAVEILEVRIGLEGLCAAKAAERIADKQIEELRALREDLLQAVASGDLLTYSTLNQQLDKRIRELSGHTTAVDILEKLRAQSVRHQFRLSFQPGRAAASAPEHAAIIDAIVSRDADAAMDATRRHLLGVIEAVKQLD